MFDRLIHPSMTPDEFQEPRWARFLFEGTTAAWLWLVVRLYMAYVYLPAGWGKITSGKWLFGDGSPIQGLVSGAISSEDTPAWYGWFLETHRPAEREPLRDARGTRRNGHRSGAARRPADRDRRLCGRVRQRELRPGRCAWIEPGADHPRRAARAGLAECRLDRSRSMVHPVGAPDVLRGVAASRRTDTDVGLIATTRVLVGGGERPAIVERWKVSPGRGPVSGGTRSVATGAVAASTPTATRRMATASRERKGRARCCSRAAAAGTGPAIRR